MADHESSFEYHRLGRAALALGKSAGLPFTDPSADCADTTCSILLVQSINLLSRCVGAHENLMRDTPLFWSVVGLGMRSALQVCRNSTPSGTDKSRANDSSSDCTLMDTNGV